MSKELSRHFSGKDIQVANMHMKRDSTLLINREMQIRITMRYLFPSIRMAVTETRTTKPGSPECC